MSSVCHGPEVRRLLPAPRQAGVRQRAGTWGGIVRPRRGTLPGNLQLQGSSGKQFIWAALWLDLRSRLPLIVSSSLLNPRTLQIGFWNYMLWTETDLVLVHCDFTKTCRLHKPRPFLLSSWGAPRSSAAGGLNERRHLLHAAT